MDINNVAQKILGDAQAEKDAIIKKAEEEAKKIIEKAKEEKKAILKSAEDKGKTTYKEVYEIEKLKAESSYSRKILEYKLESIDRIIESIRKELENINKKDYEKFLSKVFSEINIEEGEFIIGSKEKNLNDKTIKTIAEKNNIKLKKSKIKPDFETGIRIIKGKARYNISPIFQFNENIDKYKMELSAILFPKED